MAGSRSKSGSEFQTVGLTTEKARKCQKYCHYAVMKCCTVAAYTRNDLSPNTVHWQQQINSSFDVLVNSALLSPPSTEAGPVADCSDWRYAVEDLRGVCPAVIDDLQRKDWSLRHLEQRSDSRDSGLESDPAFDRRLHAKKPSQVRRHSTAEDCRAEFTPPWDEPNHLKMNDAPVSLTARGDPQPFHLYGVLGKKKPPYRVVTS